MESNPNRIEIEMESKSREPEGCHHPEVVMLRTIEGPDFSKFQNLPTKSTPKLHLICQLKKFTNKSSEKKILQKYTRNSETHRKGCFFLFSIYLSVTFV